MKKYMIFFSLVFASLYQANMHAGQPSAGIGSAALLLGAVGVVTNRLPDAPLPVPVPATPISRVLRPAASVRPERFRVNYQQSQQHRFAGSRPMSVGHKPAHRTTRKAAKKQ